MPASTHHKPVMNTTDAGTDTLAILGGSGPDGKRQLLLTAFKAARTDLPINLAGVPRAGTARVWRLDASTVGLKEEQVSYSDGVLRLGIEGSTVLLVRF